MKIRNVSWPGISTSAQMYVTDNLGFYVLLKTCCILYRIDCYRLALNIITNIKLVFNKQNQFMFLFQPFFQFISVVKVLLLK